MMLRRMDATSIRYPNDKGARKPSPRPVSNSAEVIVDLIEAGIEETFKLNLCYRTNPVDRHAKGYRHDPQLRQWRIHHTVHPEFLLQPIGDTKDAAFFSYVFAKDHHPAVPF